MAEGKYWDTTEEIAGFEYTETTEVRISKVTKGASTFIDIRKYYMDKKTWDGEMKPGKGVALKAEKLDDLIGALMVFKEELDEHNAVV